MSHSNNNNGGWGFAGLLTILFIGLKLAGYINWSWWWVLSPVWITIAVLLPIGILLGVIVYFKQPPVSKQLFRWKK